MTWARGPWASGPWADQQAPAGGGTTHATTGALAADAAAIAGTAAHYTLHATSGAIASDAAAVAGTAVHYTLHATDGALASDAASIEGAAEHSGAGAVVDVPSAKGAGKARKKRKKYTVEIDGEQIAVASEAEAVELLENVARKAKETAELAISRAAKAKRKPTSDVLKDARKTLKLPEVAVSSDLDTIAAYILRGVESVYEDAMQTIEITALLNKRAREDEDDEDILLLLV